MTAWHKLSYHERGVPEVGFRLVRTNNQPNHGAVRSQSPQEGPRARRGARRWSRVLGLAPKCAMGTGGWCSYGASDEHQEAQDLVELARRTTPADRWLRRKPAWVCSRRRHGREGAEAALQSAKRSRRTRSSSRGRRWHPMCPCHDRRPRSTRSSRGMAGFLASGTSVSEVEPGQRTRFFIECRENFDE